MERVPYPATLEELYAEGVTFTEPEHSVWTANAPPPGPPPPCPPDPPKDNEPLE